MQATLIAVERAPAIAQLSYSVSSIPERWVLTEDKVSESTTHDGVAEQLKGRLDAWARRTARRVRIARNLAVRWLKADPRIGIDPDVCLLEPPPEEHHLDSLRTWLPGHAPPRLCFEIVSKRHPHKDYAEIQERYAAMGTEELIVFDPLLAGPRLLGGPVLLQHWVRHGEVFARVDFGDEPVRSEVLDGWLIARDSELLVADDREGTRPWWNEAEHERAEKERERALRQDLERELAELRAARSG